MYAALFNLLPGPRWFKVIEALIILAVIVLVLMEVVYPWLGEYNIFSDSTMDTSE